MRKSKKPMALIMMLLLAVTLCGCTGGKQEKETEDVKDEISEKSETEETKGGPVEGGNLTVGIAQDLDDNLDPYNTVSAGTREVLFNIYEGLVKPDTDGNLIPAIASDYIISDDGDTYTFTIRDGVKFHNGKTVTTDDIVYSIKCAGGLDGESKVMKGFDELESVDAPDEKTVVIKLKKPNTEFLAMLTAAIIPEGNDPTADVIGTGPFTFINRNPQESIKLEKFDDYWGDKAHVDTVTYKIIDSAETLVMSLKSGALDLVAHLTSAQANELGDEFTLKEGTMNLVQAVYLNNDVEPFNNVKVRQALSYAIDRDMIMKFLADGRGASVGSSMYPNFKKYFKSDLCDYYKPDAEKAKQMLSDAGYPDGFEMTVKVPSNYQPHVDTAKVIAQQLGEIGVTVNVKLIDWDTWLNDVYNGRNFEATVVGVDASSMTARAMLERFTSTAGDNFINFNNAEYDETFDKAISTTDEAEQVELYGKLQTILTEQAANLYIQDLCDIVALGNGVEGYEFYPIYVMDMSKVYFTK